jgi:hypothetical protein
MQPRFSGRPACSLEVPTMTGMSHHTKIYKNTSIDFNLNLPVCMKRGKEPKKEQYTESCPTIKLPDTQLNLKWRFKLKEFPSQFN